MKFNRKFGLIAGISALGVASSLALASGVHLTSEGLKEAKAEQLDLITRLCGGETVDGVRQFVKDDYTFKFQFSNVAFGTDSITIGAGGYLRNVTAFNGIQTMTFNTTLTNLSVSAGKKTSNGIERYHYFGKDYDVGELSYTYDFTSRDSSHFVLKALDNAVELSEFNLDYTCSGSVETDTVTDEDFNNYTWDFKGAGSETTPFLIESVTDWEKLTTTYGSKTFLEFHFSLRNDLGDAVHPVTTSVANFKGYLHGNNHTIYENLSSSTETKIGLFNQLTGSGSIYDLTVEGSVNYGGTENAAVGGIVAYANTNGTISNCVNKATIVGYTKSWMETSTIGGAGGIVGRSFKGSIVDCTNYGSITSEGKSNQAMSGGIIGTAFEGNSPANATAITRCTNFGNVGLTNKFMAGGIIALANRTSITIKDCVNGSESVHPKVQGNKYIGGIAGIIYNNIVQDGSYVDGCVNFGEITASLSSTANLGGIAGISYVEVTNCTNKYIVTSGAGNPTALHDGADGAGWVVGIAKESGTTLTGSTNEYVPA